VGMSWPATNLAVLLGMAKQSPWAETMTAVLMPTTPARGCRRGGRRSCRVERGIGLMMSR